MHSSESNFRRRAFIGSSIASLAIASPLIDSMSRQVARADDDDEKEQRSAFRFYKQLETTPAPFSPPLQNAYWYGQGKFDNSHKVYNLKVTLNTLAKFPNNPEPFVITPTAMKYEISAHRFYWTVTFVGYANLNSRIMFLHNGTVTPVVTPTGPIYPYANHNVGTVRMFGYIRDLRFPVINTPGNGPAYVDGVITFG